MSLSRHEAIETIILNLKYLSDDNLRFVNSLVAFYRNKKSPPQPK